MATQGVVQCGDGSSDEKAIILPDDENDFESFATWLLHIRYLSVFSYY